MEELSYFSPEGDRQEQDKRRREPRRGFRPRPMRSERETVPTRPLPEFHVPASVIAPETNIERPHPIVPAEALHSNAWLGLAVDRPEFGQPASTVALLERHEDNDDDERESKQQTTKKPVAQQLVAEKTPTASQSVEDDATFQRLLKEAGLDELAHAFDGLSTDTVKDVTIETHETSENLVVPELSTPPTSIEAHDVQPKGSVSEQPEAQPGPEVGNLGIPVPSAEQPNLVTRGDSPPPERPERPTIPGNPEPLPFKAVSIQHVEQSVPLDSREYIPRSVAKKRALFAFAAGLILGNHHGKKKVRRELNRVVEEIQGQQAIIDQQRQFQERQAERQTYNKQAWERRLQRPEQPAPIFAPTAERAPVVPNVESETGTEATQDPFNLQPDQHVEHDAWHSIVVDKYGREDLSAREQYGQAFHQEQREVRSQSPIDDQGSVGMSMGTTPLPTTTQLPVIPQFDVPELPSGITQSQLPSGTPLQEDPQHLLPPRASQSLDIILNPWLWLLIGLLLLVFFAATIL